MTFSSDKNTNSWFPYSQPRPESRLRLFCLPYAGSGAIIYRKWHERLSPLVEVLPVQLPGRGNRMGESPITSIGGMIQSIAQAMPPYLDKPFAFFGHSMGALVSFELARLIRKERGQSPVQLFLSGRRAAHIPATGPPTYNLPEPEFINELRHLNGTPGKVLDNQELMALMIPILRADFQVCQTYVYSSEDPFTCPLTVFGGINDPQVSRKRLQAWKKHSTGPFMLRMLQGDHFFLHSSESVLLDVLSNELQALLRVL